MDLNKSKKNIDILRDIIQKDKRVAAFVGAGTSKTLGIKDWPELLEEMNKEFGADINIIKSINKYGFVGTATIIYNSRKKRETKHLYNTFMHKQFEPKCTKYTGAHIEILNTFKVILTTNYDVSFENAFNAQERYFKKRGYESNEKLEKWKLPYFKITEILLHPHLLVYLHGNNDEKRYVFLEDEYKCNYPSNYIDNPSPSELERFLRDVFNDFTLVFIGFSFSDENFCNFFERVMKEFQANRENFINIYNEDYLSNMPSHFIVISDDELKYSVNKQDIFSIFEKGNENWKQLFIDSSKDELLFKSNAEVIINNLWFIDDVKEKISKIYYRCLDNQKRFKFLEKNKINIISFERAEYREIENILTDLQIQETTTGKNLELEVKNV